MSAASETRRICMLIHGASGHGKSRLADGAPGPRLLFDAEGGAAEWTPSPKAYWDPAGPLPENEDVTPFDRAGPRINTNTTVVVTVKSWDAIEQAYRVLASGQHYFESVIWDSITEIQETCKAAIEAANGGSMQLHLWGTLFERMADRVKDFRDLRLPPNKPVHTIFLAISHNKDGGPWKADVQGALIRKLPGYVDVVGYLKVVGLPNGGLGRIMAIQPLGDYDAKDRTDVLTQHYGNAINNPTMTDICAVLRGES